MEDAFADLLLSDPEDEKPMTSREARIARAFDESKKSYPSEIVVTPPGWFQVHTIQSGDLTKLDSRHLEWSVQRLYLQRSYKQSLSLAIEILFAAGIELDPSLGTSPTPNAAGTLPKNEARDREMLDTAIRCAIKLGETGTALGLAEVSRSRWQNNPGLAHTAGSALLWGNKPFDAISALLHAVRARTPSYQVLDLLAKALRGTVSERENDTPGDISKEKQSAALKELSTIVGQYADRTKVSFDKGLFPEHDEQPKPKTKEKANVPPESTIRTWATEAELGEVDVDLMVALCCTGDAEGEETGERSVRTL